VSHSGYHISSSELNLTEGILRGTDLPESIDEGWFPVETDIHESSLQWQYNTDPDRCSQSACGNRSHWQGNRRCFLSATTNPGDGNPADGTDYGVVKRCQSGW
jgi:hypothetical protein